jgi:hypothetical protein
LEILSERGGSPRVFVLFIKFRKAGHDLPSKAI